MVEEGSQMTTLGPGHSEKVCQSVCSLRVRIEDRRPNHRGEPSDLLLKQNGGKKKIKGLEGPARHSPACTRPQAPPGHGTTWAYGPKVPWWPLGRNQGATKSAGHL